MSILTHKGDCGDMNTLTNQIGGRRRKIHRKPEYRAQIVEQCAQYGVSIAAVARQHDLNVNVVYGWIRDSELSAQAVAPVKAAPGHVQDFVRLPCDLNEPVVDAKSVIKLKLQKRFRSSSKISS
jgi:transposase-like protein